MYIIISFLPRIFPSSEVSFWIEVLTIKMIATVEQKGMQVWAAASNTAEASSAKKLKAPGIGLYRIESLFEGDCRLSLTQQMISSALDSSRQTEYDIARDLLSQFLMGDFRRVMRITGGRPVVYSLLDKPLQEFFPDPRDLSSNGLAQKKDLMAIASSLREDNRLLGLRGTRLIATRYSGFHEIALEAIGRAAADVRCEGIYTRPEIMAPLISDKEELKASGPEKLDAVIKLADKASQKVKQETDTKVNFKFSAEIGTPRAAIMADEIAPLVHSFTIDLDDLTTTTYALSKESIAHFLPGNPFQTLDRAGVGKLVIIAIERGRGIKPDLMIRVCGESVSDPSTLDFLKEAGVNCVIVPPNKIRSTRKYLKTLEPAVA